MLDVEASWISDENDVMDIEENLLKYMFTRLKETYGKEIEDTFHVTLSDVSVKSLVLRFKKPKEF